MALSERDRRELHELVETQLGVRTADLLLAMSEPELPAVLRGEMASLTSGLRIEMSELREELRGEMSELRGEMSELRGEMSHLREELRGEMSELRGDIAELRGQMAAQVPRFMAVNFAAMIGLGGLVLASAALV